MLKEKANKTLHIAIVEPSVILREGLCSVLSKSHLRYDVILPADIDEISQLYHRRPHLLVMVNPILVVNRLRYFMTIKSACPEIAWIAIQYMYFDQQLMELFNEIITLHDSPELIAGKLKRMQEYVEGCSASEHTNALSDRETQVLLHLASGKSNKEIADILNISINTVITHRKNISQKTGIRTVSGLTIYAISQGLIKP